MRSAGGRQGEKPGEVPGAFRGRRWLQKHPRAAKPPGRLPLPGPPPPGYLRAWLCTRELRGRVRLMGRGPQSPGRAGGSLGLRGGLPAPPPLPGGAGAPRAGWEVPGAAAAPRPSRRSGCGPGRGSARPPGRAAGLSLPAGPSGWGLQAGGCGPGRRRGLAGRCFRGSGTPPRPSRPLRPPPLPRARPSFPAGARCHDDAAPGPPRSKPRGFSPSCSFLLFFLLLSLRVPLAGWRDELQKVLASSGELTSHGGEGDGRKGGK